MPYVYSYVCQACGRGMYHSPTVYECALCEISLCTKCSRRGLGLCPSHRQLLHRGEKSAIRLAALFSKYGLLVGVCLFLWLSVLAESLDIGRSLRPWFVVGPAVAVGIVGSVVGFQLLKRAKKRAIARLRRDYPADPRVLTGRKPGL